MKLSEAVVQLEAELAQGADAFKATLVARFPNVPPTNLRPSSRADARSESHPVALYLQSLVGHEAWVTYGWIPESPDDTRTFLPAVCAAWNERAVVLSEGMTRLIEELDREIGWNIPPVPDHTPAALL